MLLIVLLILSNWVHGAELFEVLQSDHSYQSYYQFKLTKTKIISLLNWELIEDQGNAVPPEAYQRNLHFKGWIRDPSHKSCFDVRSLALQRQAEGTIITNPKNQCMIYKSKWYDPYSNQYFYNASDVDIDHLVPLKNAYYSGAWDWTKAKRCNFSNFLEDRYHLIVVESSENRSKGSRGPDKFIPINPQFQCLYLASWLRVKAFWNLRIAVGEAQAIHNFLDHRSCPKEYFFITFDEFSKMQSKINAPPKECLN